MTTETELSAQALTLSIKQIETYVLPTALLGSVYAAILIYGVYSEERKLILSIWFGLIAVSNFIWFYFYRLFEWQLVSNKKYLIIGGICGATGGLIWGSIGLLLPISYSADFLYILTLLIIINTVPQMGVAQIPLLQRSFVIACLTPIAINPFYYGVSDMYWLSAVIVWIGAVFLFFGNLYAQTTQKTHILGIKNQLLVKKLDKEKQAVERASNAKTKFLAAASHDLRQPLQAQHFFIEALQKSTDKTQQQQLIQRLQQSTNVLENLLNSLLDISKLDAGVVGINIVAVNLNAVFTQLEDELKPLAMEKQLRLIILPTNIWVKSDATLLMNILRNLLTNAVRYTHKGYVLMGCLLANQQVQIQVRDSGIGIQQDKKDLIFDEFYQINNTARNREQGLGLGLSIVKRLSALLEHQLTLNTARAKGCCFGIGLSETTAQQPIFIEKVNTHFLQGKTLLIVDDDELILDSLGQLLDSWYCEVLSAKSSLEALEHSKNNSIDAMIIDLNLGEQENGDWLIKQIRKITAKNIPALILTGQTHPEKLAKLSKEDFVIVHKPVEVTALKIAVQQILKPRS